MSEIYRNTIVAERYAEHRDCLDEDFVDILADLLGDIDGPILDVGAGAGAPAAALKNRGFQMIAAEPSAAMIVQGQARHTDLPFIRCVGESLPIADRCVSAVLIMYVLHHADDPVQLLAEARRVVVPGGKVIVVSARSDSDRQNFFAGYFPTLAPDLPGADEIWWWGCDAGLQVSDCRNEVHWIYANKVIDDEYLEMVECEIFASLRMLAPREFERGLRELRADRGRRIPDPEVSVLTMVAADINELMDEHPFAIESPQDASTLIL